MKKNIKFFPDANDKEFNKFLSIPVPAKTIMPSWWKDQKFILEGNAPISSLLSFKACVPFLDSLTFGYLVTTHQDIYVEQVDGNPRISWNVGPEPITYRGKKIDLLPVPQGFSDSHFAWNLNYGFKLPKGYSAIFTHPLNRFELPFMTVSGIVDEGIDWSGSVTFWIKDNFSGIIPMGTPILQIIPFKKENWKSEKGDSFEERENKKHEKLRFINSYYKKFIYNKKSCE